MADEDLDQLAENAAAPAAAEVDGVIARQHNLRDQIAFYRFQKEQTDNPLDTDNSSTGFRISRVVPPGSV